MTSASSDSQ